MTDPTALPAVNPSGDGPATGSLYLTMDGELMAGEVLAELAARDAEDAAAAAAAAASALPLRDRVLGALAEESIPAQIDEDGDVGLVVDDQRVFVRCVDSQPPMARVFGQWVLDGSVASELTWLRAANAVTGAVNLVKASVHGDRLVVAVDLVVAPGLTLGPVLTGGVGAVLDGARTWQETVAELTGRRSGAI